MLESRRKARQAEQEAALAQEMERRKREEESKRLEIQRICDADPSLRELQTKLKMAYVAKERAEQIKAKAVTVEEEKRVQAAIDAAQEEARVKALEVEKVREEEHRLAMVAAKKEVEKQLHEKVRRPFALSRSSSRHNQFPSATPPRLLARHIASFPFPFIIPTPAGAAPVPGSGG